MARALRPDWTLHFAESTAQALASLAVVTLDLVIIDVGLPGEDGFELLKQVAAFSALLPQILISGRDDTGVRIRAQTSGARAFITKTVRPELIAETIDAVLRGEVVFGAGETTSDLPLLTTRQFEVLTLLAAGHCNKEIRHQLGIAERTVRAHLTELFQLLGAHSRMQAVVRARQLGLIP